MQPVLPRTMVLGPAALAIIFMSSADSQPWQVRWPEVKNSSNGSFLTDLNGSSFCVGSICTKVAMTCLILSDAHARQLKLCYSRSPIHGVSGCGVRDAAVEADSVTFSTPRAVTSRPPRPAMNPSAGGLLRGAEYSAVRTFVVATPLLNGEPND